MLLCYYQLGDEGDIDGCHGAVGRIVNNVNDLHTVVAGAGLIDVIDLFALLPAGDGLRLIPKIGFGGEEGGGPGAFSGHV